MNVSDKLMKEINKTLKLMESQVIAQFQSLNEAQELGLERHFDKEEIMEQNLSTKSSIKVKELIKKLTIIKEGYIKYQIPFLPYLLEQSSTVRLNPTAYLLFSLILNDNLQGKLFEWKKENYEQKLGIVEKTAFNSIHNLEHHKLVIKIEHNSSKSYIVNTKTLLEIAKEYDKKNDTDKK
jgi:hypothetical protein